MTTTGPIELQGCGPGPIAVTNDLSAGDGPVDDRERLVTLVERDGPLDVDVQTAGGSGQR